MTTTTTTRVPYPKVRRTLEGRIEIKVPRARGMIRRLKALLPPRTRLAIDTDSPDWVIRVARRHFHDVVLALWAAYGECRVWVEHSASAEVCMPACWNASIPASECVCRCAGRNHSTGIELPPTAMASVPEVEIVHLVGPVNSGWYTNHGWTGSLPAPRDGENEDTHDGEPLAAGGGA